MEIVAVVAGIVFIIVALNVRWPGGGWQPALDKSNWHVVEVYRRNVKLVDGTNATRSTLWGRKVNGQWQYRDMTDKEYEDHLISIGV